MNNGPTNRSIVTRFYNHILFDGNRVIKGVSRDRLIKEIGWFKEAAKRIPGNIPHIYNYGKQANNSHDGNDLEYYEMQAIDGDNLYQWTIYNKNLVPQIFDDLIRLIKYMHTESYKASSEDINLMYYLKPKMALERFVNENEINLNLLVINNKCVKNPFSTLESIFSRLRGRLFDTRYSFIHGDLTMSNTLVGRDGKLYLIDPRGKFGNTKIYGDVRYDIAKLYYSIVGNFDSLNNGKFSYKSDELTSNTRYYSIVDNGFKSYGKRILNEFQEDAEVIKFIHATIWLSLLPHVSNNSNQQLCVFCHGVYLLNSLF